MYTECNIEIILLYTYVYTYVYNISHSLFISYSIGKFL